MLDYVSLAQSRLTSLFPEKPLVTALTGTMVSQLSDLEMVADQLKNERWVDVAVGKQLDGCGEIVGEKRLGRNDDDYRDAINFRIFVNTSNATPNDLMQGLRFLTKPDNIQYIEQYPATAMLFTDGANIKPMIHDAIQDLAPAGICDVPILVSFSRKDPFRFAKESAPSELFVNGEADYLTANGSDIQISSSTVSNGARLGGVAPSELFMGGQYLELSDGSYLAINNPNTNVLIGSGYQLTGLYT